MDFKVEITGLDEYRKQLESLGGNFKKVLKNGISKASKKIASDAQKNAKSKGWSEKKYFKHSETKQSKKSNSSVHYKVGTPYVRASKPPSKNKTAYYKSKGDYFYIKFPEFGTIKQAPNPVLRPALMANKENTENILKKELEDEIRKLGLE